MNQHLQSILNFIEKSESLTAEQKNAVLKLLKNADKELEITAFKLDRTEKVKKTTAILLEETIEELEQKRKAVEAQNRELEIEAALERVRSRAMAMQNSEELNALIGTVFTELTKLDLVLTRCVIMIYDPANNDARWWMANSEAPEQPMNFLVKYHEHLPNQSYFNAWQQRTIKWEYILEGTIKKEWDAYLFRETELSLLPDFVIAGMRAPDKVHLNASFNNFGNLTLASLEQLSDEHFDILLRFAKVFDLTYTRFNDLQKAEAQAREARIEAAVEKVRSRSLAMHKSDELQEVVHTVFERLKELNVDFYTAIIILFTEGSKDIIWWLESKANQQYPRMLVRFTPIAYFNDLFEIREKGADLLSKCYSFDKKNELFHHLFENTDFKYVPEKQKEFLLGTEFATMSVALAKNTGIHITSYSKKSFSEQDNQIIKRFAKVFDQAYTRFLDLQKAEAQAREAQIEAALERVRAKAMAMHKTDDLHGAVTIIFEEFQKLNLDVLRCGIGILDKDSRTGTVWATSVSDNELAVQISANESFDTHPLMMLIYECWQKQEDFDYLLQGQDLINYYKAMDASDLKLPESQLFFPDDKPQSQYYYAAMFKAGGLYAFRNMPFASEDRKIMRRFASVVNLTYNRFLDLQKAEAQARESQIELGLERVRARAMAMQTSDELGELVAILLEELTKLDLILARCIIWIFDVDTLAARVWMANSEDKRIAKSYFIKRLHHPYYDAIVAGWKERKSKWVYDLKGDDKKAIDALLLYETELSQLPEAVKQGILSSEETFVAGSFNNFGLLEASGPANPTVEQLDILNRFGKVFDLSYTRFNDLKQAEAQAREARIETGLERVRARTMAMHSSDDVSTATATMFAELEKLSIESFRGGILNIRADQTMDVWSVNNLAEGKIVRAAGEFDMTMHPFWRQLYKGWTDKDEVLYFNMSGKDKENYIRILDARRDYLPDGMQELPDSHIQSYYFGEGFIWTFTLQPHSEEDKQVMKKFASVFSLTFRRYQDLKRAEAQAREATIEAALERVRGKAMAMHNSNDLSATASMVISELRKLGIKPIRCGVGILTRDSHKGQLYTATSSPDGDSLSVMGWVLLEGHPVLEQIYEKWSYGEDYFPELSGDSMKAYYERLLAGLSVPLPEFKDEKKHYGHFFAISVGCLYAWADIKYNDDEIKILKRFATTIDLTFRRYFELQKSEENAKETVKQAALDRIRADIASMRTINDLDRITPLIWNELTILGVPFIRCGVFIMDEEQQLIHTFLSTPDGKAIAAFHLSYDTPGNLSHVISNWKVKNRYIDHWDESEFTQFAEILVKQGTLASAEQYLKTIPKDGFHLHFLPFLQGMLYVGNTTQLTNDEIELIQHVADAFSTAYARYEDFNKLEAAKQQVDKTLTDLKQAQQQLIQSEKMASLGELTAGIAHEIQNPLNFVNNFSDVSNELLEEMKIELSKGNVKDAIAISEDVKQNLEKILNHGRRADAIVKGMLQHSRTSSGQKELTDINALADEYLRLAYHGLRAKDKSFNAKFETDFDPTIEKINIVPQEIGRVILNLINNAFFAVRERAKQKLQDYDPTVIVSTRKINHKIEISIKDNGNGVPDSIKEKIFQPFFTTKPTGQGTGLGLSLSYDIIKAHGGELSVRSDTGKGSVFLIQLTI